MNKREAIDQLRAERDRWEEIITRLSEDQLTRRELPGGLSFKDIIAHLMAWQIRTRARLRAAANNTPFEPAPWVKPTGGTEDVDVINAWIHNTYKDWPPGQVIEAWREGYDEVIALAEKIPEEALTDPNRYPYMEGWALIDIIYSSREHHYDEHRQELEPVLREKGWI